MDSIEKLFKLSQIFRAYPFCHSRPDRSFCYHGRYFGLCARCTTMYIGGVIAILSSTLWIGELSYIHSIYVGCLLLVPGGVDGVTQMFGDRESNNILRAITGLLLGVGIILVTHGMVFSASLYLTNVSYF